MSLLQVDSLLRLYEVRHDLGPCPVIRPFENLGRLGCVRAEFFSIYANGNPAQVQSVGVPTGLDRDIGHGFTNRMTGTGFVKKLEFIVGKDEPLITQGQGKVAATFTKSFPISQKG